MASQLTDSERDRLTAGYERFLQKRHQTKSWVRDEEGPGEKSVLERIQKEMNEFYNMTYDFVETRVFSGFILSIILLNTGILVAQTWEVVSVRCGWYFAALDNVFLGIYIMEIVLKVYVYRKKFFLEGWNILDLTIVVFNVTDFTLPLIIQNIGGFDGVAIFRLLRIFRAVRAIRALRVLRTIRFLSNLQVIMTTCLQSMQSMGAIVMLITLFMYMFAVIGRGLYAEVAPDRFGTIFLAGFTLFQLLTLDDWFYMYSDVMKMDSGKWHILLYLLLYIVVEYFIFLNLFVAVLVDNFQLALAASSEANRKKKKAEEESDDEDEDYGISESSVSSLSQHMSEQSLKQPRKTIRDYYPKFTEREKNSTEKYFLINAALEYNYELLEQQQRVLNKMVDMCVEVGAQHDTPPPV